MIGDPYIITTPAELQAMSTDLAAYYARATIAPESDPGPHSPPPFFGGLDGKQLHDIGINYRQINNIIVVWCLGPDQHSYSLILIQERYQFGYLIMSSGSNTM